MWIEGIFLVLGRCCACDKYTYAVELNVETIAWTRRLFCLFGHRPQFFHEGLNYMNVVYLIKPVLLFPIPWSVDLLRISSDFLSSLNPFTRSEINKSIRGVMQIIFKHSINNTIFLDGFIAGKIIWGLLEMGSCMQRVRSVTSKGIKEFNTKFICLCEVKFGTW